MLNFSLTLFVLSEMEIEKDPSHARDVLERALEIFRKHYGQDDSRVSRVLHDLATVYDSYGEHDKAVQLHKEAIRIRETVSQLQQILCFSLSLTNFPSLSTHFSSFPLLLVEKTLGERHPQLGTSWEILGITYKLMGRNEDAVNCMLKAVDIHRDFHGEFHPSVCACYEWIVLIYSAMNRPFKAEEFETKRIAVQQHLDTLGIKTGERIVDY